MRIKQRFFRDRVARRWNRPVQFPDQLVNRVFLQAGDVLRAFLRVAFKLRILLGKPLDIIAHLLDGCLNGRSARVADGSPGGAFTVEASLKLRWHQNRGAVTVPG